MKLIKYMFSLSVVGLMMLPSLKAQSQSGIDSTGLPGDNFDLQGALQLFQNAVSIEDFEKSLNTESSHVNNLDLDGDGDIDYVRVSTRSDKDMHAFVLQVAVSEKEMQDIAVIELEKTGDESAVIQIIGDEDVYGEQIIVEPNSGEEDAFINYNYNSNNSGPSTGYTFEERAPAIVINVWGWPSVRFVYGPVYAPWVSPWRWHHYPGWWKPWRPFGWHVWHPYRAPFHHNFVVVHTHRCVHAYAVYKPYRSGSVVVRNRHSVAVNNYRVSRSRTTVTGPRGRTTTVKKTTVTGPRGNKATRVKVRRH
jgi:hypothetical protein